MGIQGHSAEGIRLVSEWVAAGLIGPVHEVIHQPAHPYTLGLMASIPDMDSDRERLNQIDGAMPRLNAIPPGCA